MSIDLRIPDNSVPTKRSFQVPQKLSAEFDLYVEAAQQDNPDVTGDLVLEAILQDRLKRDRGFRRWLKERAQPMPTLVTGASRFQRKRRRTAPEVAHAPPRFARDLANAE